MKDPEKAKSTLRFKRSKNIFFNFVYRQAFPRTVKADIQQPRGEEFHKHPNSSVF